MFDASASGRGRILHFKSAHCRSFVSDRKILPFVPHRRCGIIAPMFRYVFYLLLLVSPLPAFSAQGFTKQTLQITMPSGNPLNANLLIPRTGSSKGNTARYPVLMIFGGFEQAGAVLDLLNPKVPVIIASFDYPFQPPRKFEFPESLKFAPEAKRAIHETIDGIGQLARELRKRPDVDADRVTLIGASFGAPFALAAAAQDSQIAGLVLVHGFADVPGTIGEIVKKKWSSRLGVLAAPAAWLISQGGWMYFDAPAPEDSAKMLSKNQKVLMVVAEADTRIPKRSIEKLWRSLEQSQASRERILMPGDHLEPGATKLIAEITELVTDWMKKAALR